MAKLHYTEGCRCAICNRILDPPGTAKSLTAFTVDHIIPKMFLGANSAENLRPTCLRCNHLKGHYLPMEAVDEAIRIARDIDEQTNLRLKAPISFVSPTDASVVQFTSKCGHVLELCGFNGKHFTSVGSSIDEDVLIVTYPNLKNVLRSHIVSSTEPEETSDIGSANATHNTVLSEKEENDMNLGLKTPIDDTAPYNDPNFGAVSKCFVCGSVVSTSAASCDNIACPTCCKLIKAGIPMTSEVVCVVQELISAKAALKIVHEEAEIAKMNYCQAIDQLKHIRAIFDTPMFQTLPDSAASVDIVPVEKSN